MGTKEVMANVFSSVAKVYDTFLSFVTFGGIHRWQKRLIDVAEEGESWLDVGTGTGEVLKKLRSSKLKVGIDVAPEMLKIAKKKCEDCYFLIADGENMPFKDKSFDRISLSLVFRHLENQEEFLREANRILKRGGRIGVLDLRKFAGSKPLLFLMRTLFLPIGLIIFGKDKWEFFIHSIENSFSLEEIEEMFEKEGFRKVEMETHFFGLVFVFVAEKD